VSEKQDSILEALAGKSLTAAEVADATGDEQKKCSAMLTYMKTKGLVELRDKLWCLPGQSAEVAPGATPPARFVPPKCSVPLQKLQRPSAMEAPHRRLRRTWRATAAGSWSTACR